MLAISVDDHEASTKLKRDLHLGFPLLSDPDMSVIRAYGLVHAKGHGDDDIARPASLLLDRQGVIRWAAFTENIRVRPHADVILEKARSLQ